jgi:hypothetical protein
MQMSDANGAVNGKPGFFTRGRTPYILAVGLYLLFVLIHTIYVHNDYEKAAAGQSNVEAAKQDEVVHVFAVPGLEDRLIAEYGDKLGAAGIVGLEAAIRRNELGVVTLEDYTIKIADQGEPSFSLSMGLLICKNGGQFEIGSYIPNRVPVSPIEQVCSDFPTPLVKTGMHISLRKVEGIWFASATDVNQRLETIAANGVKPDDVLLIDAIYDDLKNLVDEALIRVGQYREIQKEWAGYVPANNRDVTQQGDK